MSNLNELLAQRKGLVEEARSILDAAEAAGRELTAEENEGYTRRMADVDAIKAKVDREVALRDAEKAAAEFRVSSGETETQSQSGDAKFLDELRQLGLGQRNEGIEIRYNEMELRDLAKGTATSGGNTVPTSFLRQLQQHMVDTSSILQANPTVITTTSGENLDIPKTTAFSTALLFAETAQITTSDPSFGKATLGAFKYGVIVPASRELIADTAVDLLGFIADQSGTALGLLTTKKFMVGAGTTEPKGLVVAASVGATATGTNVITWNEMIDLFHSVGPQYRGRASFFVNDATAAHLRKKTDSNGQYLWQPAITQGNPDTAIGRPIYTDPNIDTLATGKKVAVFGDVSKYWIRRVGSVRVERSDEFKFDTDMVYFKAVLRVDGNLIDTTGAVKYLITA